MTAPSQRPLSSRLIAACDMWLACVEDWHKWSALQARSHRPILSDRFRTGQSARWISWAAPHSWLELTHFRGRVAV